MSWKKYQLVFKLLSPLHIGYRKAGNLQQTRGYIPGKVLWAALTARLTRLVGKGNNGQDYKNIGEQIKIYFRFGYLWPSLNDGETYFYPWEHIDEFDYQLRHSYASTALDYEHQSAEEGALHETEFIATKSRYGKQVYLKGSLWVQENQLQGDLVRWKDALKQIQLGSERNYGWGRVELVEKEFTSKNEAPEIQVQEGQHIPAHAFAIVNGQLVTEILGEVEPFLGWERENTKTDRIWRLSKPYICYIPGSIVQNSISFEVTPWGILKKT